MYEHKKAVYTSATTEFLTKNSEFPVYMPYPKFLLDSDINETTQILYVLLYDRARLSMQNRGWTDAQGHVYIYYSIHNMALDIGKSETTVKNSLAQLEQKGLIVRVRQGVGRSSRIYVKFYARRCSTAPKTEYAPCDSQKIDYHTGKILPANKNRRVKTKQKEAYYSSYSPMTAGRNLQVRNYDSSEEDSL